MSRAFVGTVVHSSSPTELEIIKRGVVVVDEHGIIVRVARYDEEKLGEGVEVVDFGEAFIAPGLIDTHAHAPQYAQLGLGTDLPLLDWLQKYTFPTETKFSDVRFARRVYEDVVRRFISNGTTSCCYFASLHLEASKVLCDVCLEVGQHAFVGKVCMDRNSPDTYREASAKDSLEATRAFARYCLEKGGDLVKPIVTPRFAISCTSELMEGLGKLAEEMSLPVQSHIGENDGEIKFTCSLHPENKHYADVYASRGLMTHRTIMAHAVHMTDDELTVMAKAGSGVSHCPRSNFTLFSGVAPIRRLQKYGIPIGLGTDCSGGFSPSIWDAMRTAIEASAAAFFVSPEAQPLSYKEVFYMATQGGARLMGMQEKLGTLAPGKWFNVQIIDPKVPHSPIDSYGECVEDLFQKCFYLLDDRNITNVYVKGRKVK